MTDYGRQYRDIYVQFGHQNVSGGWDTPIRKGDEMSVRRRRDTKTPRWTARWKNSAGRWQTKDFKTKAEAQRFEARMKTDVQRGEYSDPHAAKAQIGRIFEDWRPTQVALKPKSLDAYDSLWRCLVAPRWAARPLSSVTRAEVKNWISEGTSTSGKKVSSSRMRQAVQLLSNLLNHAVDMGLINRNPLGRLKSLLPKLPSNTEKRALELSQLTALANNCGQYRVLVLLAGLTGIRWAELVALTPEDFDFENGCIRVSKSMSEVNGHLHSVTTKSGKARELPVPRVLETELKQLVLATNSNLPVFKSPRGGYLRKANFRRNVFSPALDKTDLVGFRFHDLRHTAVSLQLAAGTDFLSVSKVAGHSRPSTTLNVYAHELDSSIENVRNTIDQLATENMCDRFVTDGGQRSA